MLSIDFTLEEPCLIGFLAESREDEMRLRTWLRRSEQFRRLPELLERLVDDLDEADRRNAA
jgi:hypothetical protein